MEENARKDAAALGKKGRSSMQYVNGKNEERDDHQYLYNGNSNSNNNALTTPKKNGRKMNRSRRGVVDSGTASAARPAHHAAAQSILHDVATTDADPAASVATMPLHQSPSLEVPVAHHQDHHDHASSSESPPRATHRHHAVAAAAAADRKRSSHRKKSSRSRKSKGRLLEHLHDGVHVIGSLNMQDMLCRSDNLVKCGGDAASVSSVAKAPSSDDGIMSTASSSMPNSNDSVSFDGTIDSDKELELHARQIRLELRQAEMIELLQAAEQAAASGQKSFAGRTSTFGDDDPELEIPPEQFKKKATTILSRQPILRRSMTFGTPLGRRMLPDNFKISVKALRDVAEVVPSFKDFHKHLRTHFLRRNVAEATLIFSQQEHNPRKKDDNSQENKRRIPKSDSEHRAMQLWNSFSLHSWHSTKPVEKREEAETKFSQEPAEKVSERQPTQKSSDTSSTSCDVGELIAEHKYDEKETRRSHVEVPPGLTFGAALGLNSDKQNSRLGSVSNHQERRRVTGGFQSDSAFQCPTTPQQRFITDRYNLDTGNGAGLPIQDGSPNSPIVVDDLGADRTYTPYQNNRARIYEEPNLPPGLPMTPKDNFHRVFDANFATRDGRARNDPGGSLQPDFVTPVRLRDIRGRQMSESESSLTNSLLAHRQDRSIFGSDQHPDRKPYGSGQRRAEGIKLVDVEVLDAEAAEREARYRLKEYPEARFLFGDDFERNGPGSRLEDQAEQRCVASVNGEYDASEYENDVIDVEALQKVSIGDDRVGLGYRGNLKPGSPVLSQLDPSKRVKAGDVTGGLHLNGGEVISRRIPDQDTLIDEPTSKVSYERNDRNEIILIAEHQKPIVPDNNSDQGSVADDNSRAADQSRATADFPCECLVSPASSLDSDLGQDAVAKAPTQSAWNILEQGSGGMLSRISPSIPRRTRNPTAYTLPKENDEFISNYLYCSKTSSAPAEPAPVPICSGAVPCQETRIPCAEIAVESCVGSFLDSAQKFLPRKKQPEERELLSLSRGNKKGGLSWYDLANERFDHLLERLLGSDNRSSDRCRISFQAPALKERKAPQALPMGAPSHDEVYDDDLEGVVFIQNSTSASTPPRQMSTELQRERWIGQRSKSAII